MNESLKESEDVCAKSDEENELKGKEKEMQRPYFLEKAVVGSGEITRCEYYLIRTQQAKWRLTGVSIEKSSDDTSVQVWMIGVVWLFNFHLMCIVVCWKHFATLNRIPL